MNGRAFLVIGAALGFLTVALGAFGAHVLKTLLSPDSMNLYQKAVYYQGLHTMALLITGILSLTTQQSAIKVAGWSFLTGILLFSGSLYLLALTGYRSLGAITPIGGVAFLVGWASLGLAAWRLPRDRTP